jgi:cyclopropane fatty-acyl-phospholipid synthase-like methyltransferase
MIESTAPADAAKVADHYDDLDELYRAIWGEHVHHGLWRTGRETKDEAVRALVTLAVERGKIGSGSRVVDVGCGYGATARVLAREIGAEVVGFTVSSAQREIALSRARPDDRVRVLRADWLENNLPAQSFDAAVAIESTEHMVDKPRCFAEIRRVLEPGGRAVIAAWLAAEHPKRWQVRFLLEPICREGRLPAMGTETDYRALLESAGLRLESFEDLTPNVARTWTICARRSAARLLTDSRARAYVFGRYGRNRVFLKTVFRIRLAYAIGAMRYGMFTATAI